jgi:hypothetical protein
MNIDLNQENDRHVEEYSQCLAQNGFECYVLESTRVTLLTSTRIDHMFIRCSNRINQVMEVCDSHITDHKMLFLTINVNPPKRVIYNECSYVCIPTLISKMEILDFESALNETDVNVAFKDLYGKIKDAMQQSRKTSKKKLENVSQPWMTNHLLQMIKKKKKLFRKLYRSPYDEDLKSYVNTYKNKLTKKINISKNSFYNKEMETCGNNPKKMWNKINKHLGKKQSNEKTIVMQNEEGLHITDNEEKAQVLNDFFGSVAKNLINKIDRATNSVLENSLARVFPLKTESKSIFLNPVDVNEMSKLINALKTKKSPGEDLVTARILKAIYPFIVTTLVHVANLMLSSGIFPETLKCALIIPIPKITKTTEPKDFRPISLLPVFSKIFESIVCTRIVSFYEATNFLSEKQFGFRSGMGTKDAIIDFVGNLFNNMNTGIKSSALFIDISKAFDTISHCTLLTACENSGIRGNAKMLVQSYLENRRQRVRVKDKISSESTIEYGTPQGSTLGPLLFLVIINSLCKGKFKGRVTMYADDTVFLYSGKTWEENFICMQSDLKNIRLWFDKNNLTLNETKSKYINFDLTKEINFDRPIKYHKKQCLISNDEQCDCDVISATSSIKYLGLVIDSKLNWKEHVQSVLKSVKPTLRHMYFLRKLCSAKICTQVFYSLVHSRLTYGIEAWGGTYHSRLKPLMIMEKHFIKIINKKKKREASYPIYKQMELLPLRSFYLFRVLRVFYNKSGECILQVDSSSVTRQGAQRRFPVPRPYKEFYKMTFKYQGPVWYNKFPTIMSQRNPKSFLSQLKSKLMSYDPKTLEQLII